MKKVYWRPKAVSRSGLLLIAITALAGLFLVENYRVRQPQPYYEEKMAAAELTAEAYDVIHKAHMDLGYEIDEKMNITQTGVLGIVTSPVTTSTGDLTAKRTSINPNFAAIAVQLLKEAGVEAGDVVAVGVSGSFPAVNASVYAAIETLQAEPIVIASGAASQWGANLPNLLWLDMERILAEEGVFKTRAIAASVGGIEDQGLGLSAEGRQMLEDGIQRNGIPPLTAETFEAAIEERLGLYDQVAAGRPIKAYINVGAGAVSTGRGIGKDMFLPGLNVEPPEKIRQTDGIMPRYILEGVPVLHFAQMAELAKRYGMPVPPLVPPLPGESTVCEAVEYSKPAAAAVLCLISILLYAFVRSDVGLRLLKLNKQPRKDASVEPMV